MVPDPAFVDDVSFAPPITTGSVKNESWFWSHIRRVILGIFVLNVLSAFLFIHFVNRPVYDDPYNMSDVRAYASQGVSVATIRANKNPPGPAGFAWMAATVRLLEGEALRDARVGALLSWILLVPGVFVLARFAKFPQLWYGALLASFLFPHSLESASLVLTEGPALLFAVLGAVAWVECMSQPKDSLSSFFLVILGGLFMGLAVTCRQYFLALLPAALLLALYQSLRRRFKENARWYVGVTLSLFAATIPVLLLVLIWGGFTSPGMATATSYPNWTARVGLNLDRPVIAAFYMSAYFLPLTVPASFQWRLLSRWRIVLSALCGVLAALFCNSLLQPGPLRSATYFVARGSLARSALVGVIASVAIYNAATALALVWEKRAAVLLHPPIAFAVLALIFFVAEQIGVGGNMPFYDRYLLQMAPFVGLIAFALFPRMTRFRWAGLGALFLVSQIMLWRFA